MTHEPSAHTLVSTDIDYPSLCQLFLQRTKPLDDMTRDHLLAMRQLFAANTQEGHAIGEVAARHMRVLTKGLVVATQQFGYAVGRKIVPIPAFQTFCDRHIDESVEALADVRAGHFASVFGAAKIGQLLPHDLRTQQAASYMHHNRRYALKALIECNLS